MSRKSNIRWGRSDYARLAHKIKKVNEKIFSIEVKRPDIAEYQPNYLTYKDVKESITTRQELNRFLNKYDRYLREGSEEIKHSARGGNYTVWSEKEYKIDERVDNARKNRELNRIKEQEVKVGGEGTGQTRAEMGKIRENALKPSHKNFNNMSQKEIDIAIARINARLNENYRNEKAELMRQHYLKGLREHGFLDADPNLEELINKLPIQKFIDTVELDDTATFDWYKDPQAFQVRLEYMQKSWNKALAESQGDKR